MLGEYIRKTLRMDSSSSSSSSTSKPGAFNRHVTPLIQTLTRLACTHPMRTITFILLLASTSYIGLLESSLFEAESTVADTAGFIDFDYLSDVSRTYTLGQDSDWKWQEDARDPSAIASSANHLALVTLVFPYSASPDSAQNAPAAAGLLTDHQGLSAKSVPSTSNPFSPISQDSSLAYSVSWKDTNAFLQTITEIPESQTPSSVQEEARTWLAKAARKTQSGGRSGSFRRWATNAWTEFVDLLKHAETLDISIMFLGYLAMHLTFVSLFMSMRRMGSNFWLATTTLFNSVFAFCFGLVVTTKLGVPINMVLLSEGLPFLVVTVGFEKPIVLTKAVLSASLAARKTQQQGTGSSPIDGPRPNSIQQAVQTAVREKGFDIVRDYAVEILILIAGAASGIQGGLRQFCFLAAWILLFDMILLFTFYTAILCVKLEINRIKRHVALRRALEEDGVSRRVAENVASASEWPRLDESARQGKSGFLQSFGGRVGDASIPKFKVLMVGGFVLLNIINLATIPFRAEHKAGLTAVSGIQGVLTNPPIDPFKVAKNGLAHIYDSAIENKTGVIVTVLPPIKYELRGVVASGESEEAALFDLDYADFIVGGRTLQTILGSFEDPVLSKWIVAALTLSLVLNGYLFNAARWSIKESPASSANGAAVDPAKEAPKIAAPVNGSVKPPSPPIPVYVPKEGDRTKEECEKMLASGQAAYLNDTELLDLACRDKIRIHAFEDTLDNPKVMTKLESLTRAVKIRRGLVSRTSAIASVTASLERSKLPYNGYNYENVHGACCENVIGYLPLPLGLAGPLKIDGESLFLPIATTEGVLVASTSRGCKAINAGGGVTTVLTGDGMTRGPCVSFATLARAGAAKLWLDSPEGQKIMKDAFDSTSRFARLQTMKTAIAGSYLYIRFRTTTGDAMGMNMISKGCEKALSVMQQSGWEDMSIISLSGNYCSDKKPAAINWIEGRGKSVVAEAIVPGEYVRKTLKSDVNALVELNSAKNHIGSAMAGSIGGFNAHAANLVAGVYLATGQDPAQVVESSQCIVVMKNFNGDLQISVSMPCIEVGTIGGGTVLEPQQAMLDLLGVRGAHPTNPGDNARKLARVVASAVLAGELSLCAALAAGHLVRAHMAHNRSTVTSAVPTRSHTPVSETVRQAPNLAQIHEARGLAITPST